jgi:hypothetical protein
MAIFDPAITMAIGDTPRHIAPTRSYLSRGDASAMPLGRYHFLGLAVGALLTC